MTNAFTPRPAGSTRLTAADVQPHEERAVKRPKLCESSSSFFKSFEHYRALPDRVKMLVRNFLSKQDQASHRLACKQEFENSNADFIFNRSSPPQDGLKNSPHVNRIESWFEKTFFPESNPKKINPYCQTLVIPEDATNTYLAELAASVELPNLIRLDVQRVIHDFVEMLSLCAGRLVLPKVLEMDLKHLAFDDNMTDYDKFFYNLSRVFPNLEKLDVSYTVNLEISDIKKIADYFPNLRSLNLSETYDAFDEGPELYGDLSWLAKLSTLEFLDLSGCWCYEISNEPVDAQRADDKLGVWARSSPNLIYPCSDVPSLAKDESGRTALHHAISDNDQQAFDDFLRLHQENPQSVNLNARDKQYYSALHLAINYERFSFFKDLIAHGANINLKGPCNYTPIMEAASMGLTEFVQYLLEKKADLRVKNFDGEGAYELAIEKAGLDLAGLIADSERLKNDVESDPMRLYYRHSL